MSNFYTQPRAAGFSNESCDYDVRLDHAWFREQDYKERPTVRDTCKLIKDHDGKHDASANWHGHFETNCYTGLGNNSINIEIRNNHGFGPANFDSMEKVDEFCAWLKAQAVETFKVNS